MFLDDVIHELLSLTDQRPLSERRQVQYPPLPPTASDSILQALEAMDCQYYLIGKQALKLTTGKDPKASRVEQFDMAYAPFVSLVRDG